MIFPQNTPGISPEISKIYIFFLIFSKYPRNFAGKKNSGPAPPDRNFSGHDRTGPENS